MWGRKAMAEVRVLERSEESFYTVQGLARRLSVDPKTIRRLVKREEIDGYYVGTALRIDPGSVDSYLARRRANARAA